MAATRYRPNVADDRWAVIKDLVESAVETTAGACAYSSYDLTVCAAPFVDWVVNVNGYPPRIDLVFHPTLVRRYLTRTDVTWTDGTRRTYRSLLLRMSELLAPNTNIPFTPATPQATTAPYSALELDLLRSWAHGQATASRRRSASVVLALCAGAGLKSGEVLRVRRRDIRSDEGGVMVHVTEGTVRDVPLLSSWEHLLLHRIQDLAPDQWVFGAASRSKHGPNTLNNFLRTTDRGAEPDPNAPRMRNTWLITHLTAGTNIRALMQAAGLTKFDHLHQLLIHVRPPSQRKLRQELRHADERRTPPGLQPS
ncbi:site-specific integrase [Curtobacterium ammoniigenes]|uniref:site-specific integrase n=1 Tax=Curtobacterium ammoniigenes TaxID=395387 RepID=UPI0008325407|nr:site-specific integrase [Curtobacterium ammoniigenes]